MSDAPYLPDAPEPEPHWAKEPRDDAGRFDVPRDQWGRPIVWVDASE
jgi:hypothetical protein